PLPVHAHLRPRAEMSAVPAFFPEYQAKVASELKRQLPDTGDRVEQAMAYTALAPSKQVRAVLVMLCAELCRGHVDRAVPAACAIELVHASSLILDDLPSMDNAPLRRGRRANHLEFGDATAILAAFGLLNLAYRVVAAGYAPPLATQVSAMISDAVGPAGLIGGQALDLESTDRAVTFETLERIHRGQTGARLGGGGPLRRADGRRRRRADRRADGVCKEPRPGVPDRRRSARRRRDDGGNRQGRSRRRAQDDVRVVQRHRGRAAARRGALRDGRSRAGAVRDEGGSAAGTVRVRRRAAPLGPRITRITRKCRPATDYTDHPAHTQAPDYTAH